MIHILHGTDSYQVRHALREIRDALAARDDMLASNTTVLDGRALTPQELLAHATALPFLASNRLVIVEGLLGALGAQAKGRGRKKAHKDDADDPLAAWRAAVEQLADRAAVPPTTTLVFVEGALGNSSALALFAKAGKAQRFEPLSPKDGALQRWIRDHANARGVTMDAAAVRALAETAGPDLWALEQEIDKLSAYADGEPVTAATVAHVAASAADAKIWDLTEGIVAADERKALTALRRLFDDGQPPPVLVAMVVREFRQLALLLDASERGVGSEGELAKLAGVPEWRVRRAMMSARQFGKGGIREAYRLLLDADLNVKRGLQDDESALQLLVHELCALGRRTRGAGTAPRRAYAG
ncbi:MAG TPA: DNA polymerase III subunit delta [Dehalococcoidia bacterium]|nr:DNA polymerase III subunit delta [Dehalococcoidia bacterium]